MLRAFTFSLAAIVASLSATAATAAEFTVGGDRELGCIATMTGQIVKGDAKKFQAFMQNLNDNPRAFPPGLNPVNYSSERAPQVRLCLNSAGGSLAEALRIADLMVFLYQPEWLNRLGTAVPAGAKCESACAVLFMAGGYHCQQDYCQRDPDRVMHTSARLGFHAPSLVVAGGKYDAKVVNKAFEVAIGTTSKLADRLDVLRFRNSLFLKMAGTPASQMFYVTTIGQAAEWGIQLAGASHPAAPTKGNLYMACINVGKSVQSSTLTDFNVEEEMPDDVRAEYNQIYGTYDAPTLLKETDQFPPSILNEFQEHGVDGTHIRFVTDNGVDLGTIGCNGGYDTERGEGIVELANTGNIGLFINGWMMFPPDTNIATLGRWAQSYGPTGIPQDALIFQQTQNFGATCHVFSQTGKLDENRCTSEAVFRRTADMVGHETVTFTWPSGSKTVVEHVHGRDYINGIESPEMDWKLRDRIDPNYELVCHWNPSSGNSFCYKFDRPKL